MNIKRLPLRYLIAIIVFIGYPLSWYFIAKAYNYPDPSGVGILWAYLNIPGMPIYNLCRIFDVNINSKLLFYGPILATGLIYGCTALFISSLFSKKSNIWEKYKILACLIMLIAAFRIAPICANKLQSIYALKSASRCLNQEQQILDKLDMSFIRYYRGPKGNIRQEFVISGFDGRDQRTLLSFEGSKGNGIFNYWWLKNNIILFDGRYSGNPGIFMANPITGKVSRILHTKTENIYPSFYEPENKVCYIENGQIYIYDINMQKSYAICKTNGFALKWSPDGKKILFCRKKSVTSTDIMLLDIGKRDLITLYSGGEYYYAPVWKDIDKIGCYIHGKDEYVTFKYTSKGLREIDRVPMSESSKIWNKSKTKYLIVEETSDRKASIQAYDILRKTRNIIAQTDGVERVEWR
ncbi:MAG: hypothetical protein ABII64_10210 [Elusimicrobiota bacterium]